MIVGGKKDLKQLWSCGKRAKVEYSRYERIQEERYTVGQERSTCHVKQTRGKDERRICVRFRLFSDPHRRLTAVDLAVISVTKNLVQNCYAERWSSNSTRNFVLFPRKTKAIFILLCSLSHGCRLESKSGRRQFLLPIRSTFRYVGPQERRQFFSSSGRSEERDWRRWEKIGRAVTRGVHTWTAFSRVMKQREKAGRTASMWSIRKGLTVAGGIIFVKF